jgi:hypothetical protein
MKIRVVTPLGTKTYRRKPEPHGNRVYIQKARGKRAAWFVDFDQTYPSGFRHVPTIDVIEGASKAIHYYFDAKKEDQTTFTRQDIRNIADKLIPKARYGDLDKQKTPMLLYVVALLSIVNVVLTFLLSRGVAL